MTSNALAGNRIAIIGSGPGGLATALMLAQAGARVDLYERDAAVGGRTKTVTAPGGYKFDIGPTFFLYPRILSEIFASCGERLEDHVELKKLDPQYHLIFEGAGELLATPDVARLEAEVAKIAPADAKNVRRFLADNRAKLAKFEPVLQQDFCKPHSVMSPAMIAALSHLRPLSSVDEDLRRYFADPRVRLSFSFQTKYLGMSPFQCPSLFTILSFLEYEHGVFHPTGGCGAVSDAMARLAERLGVTIHLNTPVDRVLYEGDQAVGVVAGGDRHPADAVVINGDFGHAVRRLIPEAQRPRWPDAKIDKARLSCSTFMMYLGIEGDVGDLQHHTIVLAKDYERNIREIGDGILPDNPSFYVQHAGATDPTMAPKGHTSLYVLVPVPNLRGATDWTTESARYRALAYKRLEALGLKNLEARVRYERIVSPIDWRDEFGINEGATFNLSHDLGQMLYFRPHNRFGGGVYLVGGGTHPGSGLPVIFEGARITTRLLSEDLAARRRTRQPLFRFRRASGAPAAAAES